MSYVLINIFPPEIIKNIFIFKGEIPLKHRIKMRLVRMELIMKMTLRIYREYFECFYPETGHGLLLDII